MPGRAEFRGLALALHWRELKSLVDVLSSILWDRSLDHPPVRSRRAALTSFVAALNALQVVRHHQLHLTGDAVVVACP